MEILVVRHRMQSREFREGIRQKPCFVEPISASPTCAGGEDVGQEFPKDGLGSPAAPLTEWLVVGGIRSGRSGVQPRRRPGPEDSHFRGVFRPGVLGLETVHRKRPWGLSPTTGTRASNSM